MISRKSAGASTLIPPPTASTTNGIARNGADPAAQRFPSWEQIYAGATPAQRMQLLELAARQGYLSAPQVPNSNNNKHHIEDIPSPVLVALLAGQQPADIDTNFIALDVVDGQLDPYQRQTVERAINSPDLFLLQGLPASGKSRVVAEIMTQAGLKGWRVLFLAPEPAALDSALRHLTGHESLFPIRFLDVDETSTPFAEWTLSRRRAAFREESLRCAQESCVDAESRCRQYDGEDSLWESMRAVITQDQELSRDEKELEQKRAKLTEEFEKRRAAQDSSDRATHLSALGRLDEFRAKIVEQKSNLNEQLLPLQTRFEELNALAEALAKGRWWTPAWWRARWRADLTAQLEDVCQQKSAVQKRIDESTNELDQLTQQRNALEDSFIATTNSRLDESKRQQASTVAKWQEELQCRRQELRERWDFLATRLKDDDCRPAHWDNGALEVAKTCWQSHREEARQRFQFSSLWVAHLENSSDLLWERLERHANLLAGTTNALMRQPEFAKAALGPFDLLIIEQADRLSESEILKLSSRAPRWILVAEGPIADFELKGPRPACFEKLWRLTNCDPRRLPYSWSRDVNRLCCTLRPIPPGRQSALEIEHLCDFPEIELRIFPGPEPVLAQVAFPASWQIADAKRFIYRELQEVPIQAHSPSAWLVEEKGKYVFRMNATELPADESATVENGLIESIAGGDSLALEFDKSCGWERSRVVTWVQGQLSLRDHGRNFFLQTMHRLTPALRAVVSDLIMPRDWLRANLALSNFEPAVEFYPVPTVRSNEDKTKAYVSPKQGADLEMDLSAPRLPDRLPLELRSELPRKGYANFLEAQALVRRLEKFVAEHRDKSVGVLSPQLGQVMLLRKLINNSDVLRGQHIPVELPAAVEEREFDIVFVSLTRSRDQRPVPFSQDSRDWVTAITRARERLLIFADCGTLVKRALWNKAIEPLSAETCVLEHDVVERLLGYIQGKGRYAGAFGVVV